MGKRTSTTVCTRETLQCDYGRVIHVEFGLDPNHGNPTDKILILNSGSSAKLTAKECEQLANMLCPEKPVKKFVAKFLYTRVGHDGIREVEFLGIKDGKLHGLDDGQFKRFSVGHIQGLTVSQD